MLGPVEDSITPQHLRRRSTRFSTDMEEGTLAINDNGMTGGAADTPDFGGVRDTHSNITLTLILTMIVPQL